MTRNRILITSLATIALIGAAGCGTEDASNSASETSPAPSSSASEGSSRADPPKIDASVVRGMTDYDYEPAPSMMALAKQQPSVTTGEVVGWSDGRSVVESDGSGYVDTSYYAVLEVKVSESYRALKSQGDGGRIFVEVPRGGEVLIDGEAPEGTEPVYSTIEQLNAAVPAGARVIVAGTEALSAAELEAQTSDATVRNANAGHPEGVSLVAPNVQGLIFEESNGAFDSGIAGHVEEWGWLPDGIRTGNGFDHLLSELDTLTK